MANTGADVLYDLIAKALEIGADRLEVEYKDGYEEIFAMTGTMGAGIARLDSESAEAASLREELSEIEGKRKRINVPDRVCSLRVETYDSFGETAFRILLEPDMNP